MRINLLGDVYYNSNAQNYYFTDIENRVIAGFKIGQIAIGVQIWRGSASLPGDGTVYIKNGDDPTDIILRK